MPDPTTLAPHSKPEPLPAVTHSDRTLTLENYAALVDRVAKLEQRITALEQTT